MEMKRRWNLAVAAAVIWLEIFLLAWWTARAEPAPCLPQAVSLEALMHAGPALPCDLPKPTVTPHPTKTVPHGTPTRWKDCGIECGP